MTTNSTDIVAYINGYNNAEIVADEKKVKRDMCTQFDDFRLWIRELSTNSFDAGARHAWIEGWESDGKTTIVVTDDGHGMDHRGIRDYMTVYRSRKDHPEKSVGQHGVGKLSVAAIPGQADYSLLTSTGDEAWILETGCLIDDTPMVIEPVDPPPQQGTRIAVTFDTQQPLTEELLALRSVLERNLRYLPMEIIMQGGEKRGTGMDVLPQMDWRIASGEFGLHQTFTVGEIHFEAVIELGRSGHAVYQNRVFVSDRYDLIGCDLEQSFTVPHTHIRVNSPDFELPFGRHCLRNEEVLETLASYIRNELLRAYARELARAYEEDWGRLDGWFPDPRVDDIAFALLRHYPRGFGFLEHLPLFVTVMGARFSLAKLRDLVHCQDTLYMDDGKSAGIDYGAFGAPVLSRSQRGEGTALLEELFAGKIINLASEDVVFEAPKSEAPALGTRERRFQRYLGFDLEAYALQTSRTRAFEHTAHPDAADINRAAASEEALNAQDALDAMIWRVNYLVHRDGHTPCQTQLYLVKGSKQEAVVLNLNHPDVAQLVVLSETEPALAGHFGLAAVLTDTSQRLLPQLSSDTREELILIDAMSKCRAGPPEEQEVGDPAVDEQALYDLLWSFENGRYGRL